MSETYYTILEVTETSTSEEISKSYRRLSMIHHPDRPGGDKAKFQKISEAYETLSSSDKKRDYDMSRRNPFTNLSRMPGTGVGVGGPGIPINEIFATMFGGAMGGGAMGGGAMGENIQFQQSGGFGPQVRIFHNNIPVGGAGIPQKPAPIIKRISIPIQLILTGTTMPVEIERWIVNNYEKEKETEIIYVQVPKGIDDGEIIVLQDKGNILKDDCKGDIKLFVKIENNTDFRRKGLDLLLEKTITLKEALCGFRFDIKYITDKSYTITNNSGNIISTGYRKVIPNMGFSRENHVGNLIIIFDVCFPEKLAPEVLEQIKAIDF